MYEKFFALAHRPFAAAPNLECIVAHEGYIAARERLLRCLTDGCGTAVLTAPAGLGKSLLCQDLQSRLRGMFTVAYLCSAQFPNRKAMLQAILFELGSEYLGLSEDEARLCVSKAAQDAANRGRSLIVIIDEAHLVSTELLQELRSLAESSPRCATPVRLMLAGQLELEERLADPELESLNQRIACHAILESLTIAESAEYIHERLAIAGAKTHTFTEEALSFIVKAADGNPRALHQLCDHCLLSAYTIEEKPVSLETARNSLDDLRALPLHWNDAGLLDEAPEPIDDTLEDVDDDEFVSTVDSAPRREPETCSSSVEFQSESSDPGPLWSDSPNLAVFEVGGAIETSDTSLPVPQVAEAALFASVAPWPAVPVESNGTCFGPGMAAEADEPVSGPTSIDGSGITADAIDVTAHPAIDSPFSGIDASLVTLSTDDELPVEQTADDDFTLHDPASVNAELEAELDECEEDTAIESTWSRQAELLDDLEPDDFENEELIIDDRYAALDRASETLSTYFPKAPELLQFLSQYAMNHESRRSREVATSMHQPAIEIAEPETDAHEEELLATIRSLQDQLRQAASERPRPVEPRESWQSSVPESYDVVEPPEEPATAAQQWTEPVIERCEVSDIAPAHEPAAVKSEPVKTRFAQLFSRMRQRRREVEDRLRKNADWI